MPDAQLPQPAPSVRRRPLRVRVWLIALALVPLLGTVGFAYTEIDRVSQARARAEAVERSTTEVAALTELSARLLDERNWAVASAGISEFGIDVSMFADAAGVDVAGELVAAQQRVDRLVEAAGWVQFQDDLERLRSGDRDPDAVVSDYSEAIDLAYDRSVGAYEHVLGIASDLQGGADLVDGLRSLDAAASARRAVTMQLTAYLAALFVGDAPSAAALQAVAQERADYLSALDHLDLIAPPDASSRLVLARLDRSDEVQHFLGAVDDLLHAPAVADATLGSTLIEVPIVFLAATDAVEQHIDLVEAARRDVATISESIDAAAASAARTSLIRVGVVGVASLLFCVVVARALGRPLRRLASRARDLRDGDFSEAATASGPREVREAIHALNEASDHLGLAHRQARALAIGDLHSPTLSESAPGELGRSLQDALQTLAASLHQREQLSHRLHHQATHDGLTGLANRSASLRYLRDGLAEIDGTDRVLSIAFIDLDGFKLVNDQFGHPAGDEVLSIVGKRLAAWHIEGTMVGRLGGDEFVLISTRHDSIEQLVEVAEAIVDSMSSPITVGAASVELSASIGIASSVGIESADPSDLLASADLAVYRAKRQGRGRVAVCDEELRAEVIHEVRITEALRSAIRSDELSMHFQPIVSADAKQLESVEALLRWSRPDLDVYSPADFIPIAERSDLIIELDKAVVRLVARQMRAWADDGVLGDISVALNVSAAHLLTHDFVADMLNPLHEFGIDPGRVTIEVTESALVRDIELAAGKLHQLRAAGLLIAIDDFGTGYTSLGQLRRLPVDILKIDRSFVADESAIGLVELIIDIGHVLGATVVAEGIETRAESDRLAALGADKLQGYFHGRPVPATGLAAQTVLVDRS